MFNVDIGIPGGLYTVTAATAASTAGISGGISAVANRKHFVTHFSGSLTTATVGGVTAQATIESPAGTVLWQKYISSPASFTENFDPPLPTVAASAAVGAAGQAVVFKIAGAFATHNSSVNGEAVGVATQ